MVMYLDSPSQMIENRQALLKSAYIGNKRAHKDKNAADRAERLKERVNSLEMRYKRLKVIAEREFDRGQIEKAVGQYKSYAVDKSGRSYDNYADNTLNIISDREYAHIFGQERERTQAIDERPQAVRVLERVRERETRSR